MFSELLFPCCSCFLWHFTLYTLIVLFVHSVDRILSTVQFLMWPNVQRAFARVEPKIIGPIRAMVTMILYHECLCCCLVVMDMEELKSFLYFRVTFSRAHKWIYNHSFYASFMALLLVHHCKHCVRVCSFIWPWEACNSIVCQGISFFLSPFNMVASFSHSLFLAIAVCAFSERIKIWPSLLPSLGLYPPTQS